MTRSAHHPVAQREKVLVDVALGQFEPRIKTMLHVEGVTPVDLAVESRTASLLPLHDASVIVLGPRLSDGTSSAARIGWLREALPHVGVLVCATSVLRYSERLPAFAAVGADAWVAIHDDADLRNLREFVIRRLLAPPPEAELREMQARLRPGLGRLIALHCLRNSHCKWRVGEVASTFSMDPKTLNNLVRDAGAPSSGILLRLGRVLHAKELRRRTSLSQEQIAHRLGFGSASALGMLRYRLQRSAVGVPLPAGRKCTGVLDLCERPTHSLEVEHGKSSAEQDTSLASHA